ncbi:MAG: Asp-tRNA(Asn)/Glu-tRNA(Gln) amidotransferase subunit GatA [Cyanobacteria bacterium NC_groundwater_1444_Ag_S-0.65um_54_12]|nr:Asp-tRNA(Asn)/Glu-tRNA(Gln) amidotransferase subunit GatA [Cyanobacteria bacterium NC_groundwater_1444_Ag_S-0.65um_54_12]
MATAREIAASFMAKDLSAEEIVQAALSRIAALDPQVGAFLTVTERQALARARELDRRRQAGEPGGPLAAVPLALKDNLCTRGIPTTCASRILQNFLPPYDATVVERLAAAGAIIVGKTNLDEFAMGSSTETSAYQLTRNPWDLSRVPGGTSGGSAAAVAAGMVPVALGSDTGGSIRQPAACCGVVGLKPTYGLVSRFGLVAHASSLDQIGPLSRDVTDNVLLFEAVAGPDPRDATALAGAIPTVRLEIGRDLAGLRIGLISELLGDGVQPAVLRTVHAAADWFASNGALVELAQLPTIAVGIAAYYLIATAEASANLARYDGVKYGLRSEQPDLSSMYRKTRAQGFGAEVKRRIMLGTYALSAGYYEAYYQKAQLVRTKLREDYRRAFEKFDLLLSCTSPTTAFRLGEKLEDPLAMYLADIATVGANLAGIPALSFNGGFDDRGLPIGLQLQGAALSEPILYRAAYAFEQAYDFIGRRPALVTDAELSASAG